jgi:hypothetical protein
MSQVGAFCITSPQLFENFRPLFCDSEQSGGWAAGLSPALFPILHGSQTDAHQTCKSRLRQVQPGADDLRRRWFSKRVRAECFLARFVSLDFSDTFKDFLTNIALRHF